MKKKDRSLPFYGEKEERRNLFVCLLGGHFNAIKQKNHHVCVCVHVQQCLRKHTYMYKHTNKQNIILMTISNTLITMEPAAVASFDASACTCTTLTFYTAIL
jgi:hypothetical protein